MIIDALLIIFAFWHPTLGIIATVAVLLAFRHVPFIADELVRMGEFDRYDSDTWTARIVHTLLPAWGGRDWFMSRPGDGGENNPAQAVHVPVPSTPGSPDTVAIAPNDDDTIRDQFLNIMADQKDERGNYLFSANQIHAAIGGHRATVLARVRDRRSATLPPLYRTEEGETTPATHPVTYKR
jgi:hypothetical protein